jgi:hypothetical protein
MSDLQLPAEYGQVAYEAYVSDCGGESIHGEWLPDWAGQTAEIRRHWDAAARAVADYLARIPS